MPIFILRQCTPLVMQSLHSLYLDQTLSETFSVYCISTSTAYSTNILSTNKIFVEESTMIAHFFNFKDCFVCI